MFDGFVEIPAPMVIGIAAVVAALGFGTGMAVAGPSLAEANSPYARVSAVVRADATVERSKGVSWVRKVDVGRYCVKLSDPDVRLTESVPVAAPLAESAPIGAQALVASRPSPYCGNTADEVYVGTGTEANQGRDLPFALLIP
ncbi:hypothetical protein ACIQU4_41845 [Streptomyces sp. NPDC090741]|uniref:hypothetical protein n=1 Tax=Streptomyces sp. NPDC090741 TaxID=3365967 RepID=UPI00382BFEC1